MFLAAPLASTAETTPRNGEPEAVADECKVLDLLANHVWRIGGSRSGMVWFRLQG